MTSADLVSILIPTYNEAEIIEETLRRVLDTLDKSGIGFEILVIDDASYDNTADIAQETLGQKGRVICRHGNRSLSLSVLDGINKSKGSFIVVLDADGSHPPELIPVFIEEFKKGTDLIIASRYIKNGSTENFPLSRKVFSLFACFAGRLVTDIKDNTSGFFGVKRNVLDKINLTPRGFKIGLEIFVKADFRSYKEIPYIFVNRKGGKSKFNLKPLFQFGLQLFSLLIYKTFKKYKC